MQVLFFKKKLRKPKIQKRIELNGNIHQVLHGKTQYSKVSVHSKRLLKVNVIAKLYQIRLEEDEKY